MDSVPLTVDYKDDVTSVIGQVYGAADIVKLMEKGYIFEVAPQIECDGVDEHGNYINPRLLSVSIITGTARKMTDANVE